MWFSIVLVLICGCPTPVEPVLSPAIVPLHDRGAYQPLVDGPPTSRGIEAGRVELAPGAAGTLHDTKSYEEAITIVSGKGELRIAGKPSLGFEAPCLVYVPPQTSHAVANIGEVPLVYVFVAAPTHRP